MSKIAIGIDLGTTFSCVGVWNKAQIEIIANDLGKRTTPSVVAFQGPIRFIGQAAKEKLIKNYNSVVFDAKRFIGRRFEDQEIQEDIQNYPFKIKESKTKKCLIQMEYNNEKKNFQIEEISAMVLEEMKKIAEKYIGKEVTDAVITVPAYFNEIQRQATKDAGRIAGLNVLRIINEPTAAAIAYGLQNKSDKERKVLIFDLGGGTFDVTVLILGKNDSNEEDKLIEVKSTFGDSHLGGEDFDKCLMNFCIKKFKEENDIDISDNGKAKRRLKIACEKAKIELSSVEETTIEIPNIAEGEDLEMIILRTSFEELCQHLFEKCISCVKKALENANLKKDQIDDIVLVGGSTRIPKIKEIVKKFFNRDNLMNNIKINPDEAVAYGASYLASLINGQIKDNNELLLFDIIGISLGIADSKGKMEVIIPKGTRIPVRKSKIFKISGKKFHKILVKVYQGENENCKDNYFLREFAINIKETESDSKVEVIFEVNVNSIINISANQIGTNNNLKLVIEDVNLAFKNDELKAMIDDAKTMRGIDKKITEIFSLKNDLLAKCLKLKKKDKKAEEIYNWIKEKEKSFIFTKEELLEKMKELN